MWVNSKSAAEILGVKYECIKKSVQRAQKQSKNFCSFKSHICYFKYIPGIGHGGKTLQIWIDDEKRTDKDPISGKKADNSQICNGQIISQGYKADEIPQEISANLQGNKTDTRTATHADGICTCTTTQNNETDTRTATRADEIIPQNSIYNGIKEPSGINTDTVLNGRIKKLITNFDKSNGDIANLADIHAVKSQSFTDTHATMQDNDETDTHLTTHADEICARATTQGNYETDTRATMQGNYETDTRTATHVTTQADEMNKCAKIHINETKSNHKTIKDLENMQKLKAIHDFKNRPCGMGKTLWGKNVAEKYKVSLKTLYAWKKELAGDEKVEKAICFDESGNIIYQNDELCARKDDFSARNGELRDGNDKFRTQSGEPGARKDGPSAIKDDFIARKDEMHARNDELYARNGEFHELRGGNDKLRVQGGEFHELYTQSGELHELHTQSGELRGGNDKLRTQNDGLSEFGARKNDFIARKDEMHARNDELCARNGELHELHTQSGEFGEFIARKDEMYARNELHTQNDGLSEPGARKDEMHARSGADKNIDINESAENSGLIDVNEYKKVNFKAVFKSSSFELKALEWALGAWLNNPLSTKKFIFEKLKDEALKNGWNIGSYKSFARLFNKPEIKALLIRATAGERGVRNEIPPFILRDLNRYESMELICGDQIVFDFDVTNENGEVINPNAYVWVDMGSSAIIGIDIVLGKYNKISVAGSLRMALNFGVPKAVYTDNGKPELSGHVKDILSQIKGVKLKDFDDFDERVVHKRAKPGNSRAKPIENIFNHVQRWLMQEVIFDNGGAGYHKRNNKNSDEVMKKYMKSHPLDYENFINYFAKAVKKWNNHTISSRGIVPIESFIQKLDKNPVYRLDETTMEFIFSQRRVIKVRNSSVKLQINKKSYMYSHPILSKFNGKKVEVRLNGGDINSVIVLDIEKFEFLCEAGLNEKIDPRDYRALMQKLNRNEAVVKAVNKAFYYYKKLYRPDYKLNAYVGLARNVKVKSENYKKLKKKFAMSNDKLLEAM